MTSAASVPMAWPFLRDGFRHYLWPAFVVGSIVHWLGAFSFPLELPALMIASAVAEQYQGGSRSGEHLDARRKTALVVIDQAAFDDPKRYASRAPLDRCMLAEDVARLLASGLATIAIDFHLTSINPELSEGDRRCQAKLEHLLLVFGSKLVVLHDDTNAHDIVWSDRFKEVTFARGTLPARFGFVHTHDASRTRPASLASILAWRMCQCEDTRSKVPEFCGHPDQDETGGPESIQFNPIRFCDRAHGDPGRFIGDHGSARRNTLIDFSQIRGLYNDGIPLTVDQAVEAARKKQITHVLFGGEYGRDDRYATPIGTRYGVAIHAAIAADPRHEDPQWIGFLIDVGIGVLCGIVLLWCWKRYFRQRVRSGDRTGWTSHPGLAHIWIGLMLVTCLVAAAFLLSLSVYLYAEHAIWINPVPMIIGMSLDALVLGSVNASQDLLKKKRKKNKSHAPSSLAALPSGEKPTTSNKQTLTPLQHFVAGAPTGLGILLVIYTFIDSIG